MYSFKRLTNTIVVIIYFLIVQSWCSTDTSTTTGGSCEFIQVPMCRGLIQYNMTKLPNKFGHTNQNQVYWALQPWWPFIDAGCSDNLRNFLCGLFLPKCVGDNVEPHYPCAETCKKAKIRCKKQMRMQSFKWSKDFKCGRLLSKDSHRCIKPEREGKKKQNREYVLCQKNNLPMCQGIPFPLGSLPNTYLQGDAKEIMKEMKQYEALVNSRCSTKLNTFLCGAYMPFCLDKPDGPAANEVVVELKDLANKTPFVVPCRELCQEVYDQCSAEYQRQTEGLPWPAKLHCHRFPSFVEFNYINKTQGSTTSEDRMPCTMIPTD